MSDLAFPENIRLAGQPFATVDDARLFVAQVNAYLIQTPKIVKEAKDARVWETLGYPSWSAFVADELVITVQYADLLVKFAERLELLAETFDIPEEMLAVSERALRGLPAETMVSAAADAVDDLEPDADDAEKAAAIAAAAKKANDDRIAAAQKRGREKAWADIAARNKPAELEQEPAPVPAPATRTDAASTPTDAPASGTEDGSRPVLGATSDRTPDHVSDEDGQAGVLDVAPAGDEPGRVALPVPAVTTPPGWDWDVVFAMSPKAAALLHLTEPVDVAVIDDALTWCHLFFAALKEQAA